MACAWSVGNSADLAAGGDLVARCRQGDEAAWRELVGRFSRYVYAIAVRGFLLDERDAEDVFQDVFTRVYQHLDMLRDDAAVRGWIGQVTRRVCIDHLRAGIPARRELEHESIEPAVEDEALARLDETLTVWEAVRRLQEQCRDIIDRFYCHDESYKEVSEALGIPTGTVASRLSRCLDELRERLATAPPAATVEAESEAS